MREYFTKLTSNSQATVPVEVRRHLGIRPGDRICFGIGDDGRVQLKPAPHPTIASIRGAAGTVPQQLAFDEMLDNTREDWALSEFGRPQ